MPASREERPRTTLPQLFKQLAGDGVRVAEAELALSKAELAQIVRVYVRGILIGAIALVVMIVALAILAHGAAMALAPFVANTATAYLCVGLVLAIITSVLAFTANRILKKKHEPIGLIFRWLASAGGLK